MDARDVSLSFFSIEELKHENEGNQNLIKLDQLALISSCFLFTALSGCQTTTGGTSGSGWNLIGTGPIEAVTITDKDGTLVVENAETAAYPDGVDLIRHNSSTPAVYTDGFLLIRVVQGDDGKTIAADIRDPRDGYVGAFAGTTGVTLPTGSTATFSGGYQGTVLSSILSNRDIDGDVELMADFDSMEINGRIFNRNLEDPFGMISMAYPALENNIGIHADIRDDGLFVGAAASATTEGEVHGAIQDNGEGVVGAIGVDHEFSNVLGQRFEGSESGVFSAQ